MKFLAILSSIIIAGLAITVAINKKPVHVAQVQSQIKPVNLYVLVENHERKISKKTKIAAKKLADLYYLSEKDIMNPNDIFKGK